MTKKEDFLQTVNINLSRYHIMTRPESGDIEEETKERILDDFKAIIKHKLNISQINDPSYSGVKITASLYILTQDEMNELVNTIIINSKNHEKKS